MLQIIINKEKLVAGRALGLMGLSRRRLLKLWRLIVMITKNLNIPVIYLDDIYLIGENSGLSYNGKLVFPTKKAMDELSRIGIDLYRVKEILETGFCMRKRGKGVVEGAIERGNKVINVVVVDVGSYYKLIHAGQFSAKKKFRKTIGGKDGV